jgi:hypothetical protein
VYFEAEVSCFVGKCFGRRGRESEKYVGERREEDWGMGRMA